MTRSCFFDITNVPASKLPSAGVVRERNRPCGQEKLIEQLGNGVPALRAPSDTLLSNQVRMMLAAQPGT